MSAPLAEGLAVSDLRAGYRDAVVIDGISLVLAPGATLAVLGRNGVGKTTLLATLMGHTTQHGGSIRFRGAELGGLPAYRRAALGLALVPQEREIFRSLTVEENLIVGERAGRWTLARVYDFFPALAARRRNRGDQLSGGEQQMLAIGRALTLNPKVLLLDEPTEGLAPIIVEELLRALGTITRAGGTCSIIVEQNAQKILGLADRVVILERGAIVHDAASAALKADPAVLERFLGVAGKS